MYCFKCIIQLAARTRCVEKQNKTTSFLQPLKQSLLFRFNKLIFDFASPHICLFKTTSLWQQWFSTSRYYSLMSCVLILSVLSFSGLIKGNIIKIEWLLHFYGISIINYSGACLQLHCLAPPSSLQVCYPTNSLTSYFLPSITPDFGSAASLSIFIVAFITLD